MKMKHFYTLLMATGLLACSSVETTGDELTDGTKMESDSLDENSQEGRVFEMLEDYVTITTKSDLYAQFGAENIVEDTSWYAEGTLMLLTSRLTNPDNGQVINYVWQEENPEKLEMVEAYYQLFDQDFNVQGKQKVYSTSGIYSGMSLNELREWNGAEFSFSGFGWDYGGTIFLKVGSKLANSPVGMNLDFDYEADYPGMSELYGDSEFSSDAENVKKAPIFISYLSLTPETE